MVGGVCYLSQAVLVLAECSVRGFIWIIDNWFLTYRDESLFEVWKARGFM